MGKQVRSTRPPGRHRRLAIAALATTLLSAAGAVAIYAIHRTMPQPAQAALGAGSDRSTSPPPAVRRDAQPPPVDQAPPATGLQAPAVQPPLPPVSLRPDPPRDDSQAGADPSRPAADGPPRSAAKAPPRPAQAAQAPGERAKRIDPPPRDKVPPTAGAQEARPGEGARSVQAPGAPANAGREARLAEQQQAQCAGEGGLSRLICNERVRLRFCRDRWNAHPDCIAEAPRNEI